MTTEGMREVTPEPKERHFLGNIGSAVMRFAPDHEPEVVLTINGAQVTPLTPGQVDRLVRELTSLNEHVQAYDKEHRRKRTSVAPDEAKEPVENGADAVAVGGTE